ARGRASDRRAFQYEQRNRQQGDGGHFLVNVLSNRVDGTLWHEDDHEQGRHRTERECDRHAEEHHEQGSAAIKQADRQQAHRARLQRLTSSTTWSRIWMESSAMPIVMSE